MGVFWVHGYGGASLRRLGEATQLQPGSVYGAFGSKGGLFREALDLYLVGVRAHVSTAGASAQEILERWVRAHARACAGPPGRGCLLFHAAATRPSLDTDSAAAVDRAMTGHRQALRQLLIAMHPATPEADIESRMWLVTAAMAGISALARAGTSADDLDAMAEAALRAVVECPASKRA